MIIVADKKEKKRKNDNKTKNPKDSNQIPFVVDPDLIAPVRGLR